MKEVDFEMGCWWEQVNSVVFIIFSQTWEIMLFSPVKGSVCNTVTSKKKKKTSGFAPNCKTKF